MVSLRLQSREELVLPSFSYCIIDEVDSILIDEARTPLIISGQADKPSDRYQKAAKLADAFAKDVHYTVSPGGPTWHCATCPLYLDCTPGVQICENSACVLCPKLLDVGVVAVYPSGGREAKDGARWRWGKKCCILFCFECGCGGGVPRRWTEKQKTVLLTEERGTEEAEDILEVCRTCTTREQWAAYILNAIKAKEVFLKDVTYIVKEQGGSSLSTSSRGASWR